MSAPNKATPTPDVSVAGMKAGDADVKVTPIAGGGLTLSPLPVGGRRRKSRKGGKSRRRGGADEVAPAAPVMGARRKSRKTKKGARRH